MSKGLLIMPRLRVQNANGVSAPMTWGFPSMTSFLGLMWALERKVAPDLPIIFNEVGVVCHDFAPQVTTEGFTRAFHLTRNPLTSAGETAAIVEECRVHMTVSLVFKVAGDAVTEQSDRDNAIAHIAETLESMRIAGGSVLPAKYPRRPELLVLEEDPEARLAQFRKIRRKLLPGFTLVSRHDLLESRLQELQAADPAASPLDAWLDLSRLTWRAELPQSDELANPVDPTAPSGKIEWKHNRDQGWIVPIPVGYGALSPLHPAGSVARARDATTPFRFVESIYSIGQWLGPHRLDDVSQMLWYADYDEENGLYRCANDYVPAPEL